MIQGITALFLAASTIFSGLGSAVTGSGGMNNPPEQPPQVGASVQVTMDTREKISVPIFMYHSVHQEASNAWIITPEALEQDLKFLQENGYETVFIQDLVNYVHHGTALPEKPVVLSFDDGYYNNYTKLYPLLQQYQAKAVISIIGIWSDGWSNVQMLDEQSGYLTWQHIQQMQTSGLVEFGNHTWDLHYDEGGRRGCRILPNESKDGYMQLLRQDLSKLQQVLQQHTDQAPVLFTYPYGAICAEAEQVIKELGFLASVGVREGNNVISQGNPNCLYNMYRYNRSQDRPVGVVLNRLSKS